MIDQSIGNPEITRKHLSEMQTFYEAQLVAKRHYDALMTSLKPLQDAADVLRASGVVNVDALLSQPVSATKAMIDEMEAEADELNDLTPHEGEDRDFPPMPEGEGWKRNTGEQPFDDERVIVETMRRDGMKWTRLAGHFEWRHDGCPVDIIWYRKAQPVEQEAEPEPETVDHFAEATSQIEAQAETESTEPEAASDETVTEQPESVEPEAPSQPEEPKAERKSFDFTGDYTEQEILAQNGNANFEPRENQPDDIAATERAEFDAPQRQFYNPWAKTEKAEG